MILKNLKPIFCIGSLWLLSSVLWAQSTTKLTASQINNFGLTYNLPKTELLVTVKTTKTVAKCGPYFNYAEKYLGVPVSITEDATYWSLDSIGLSTYGVPNPDAEYIIQLKPGSESFFCFAPNGALLSLNEEPTYQPELPGASKQVVAQRDAQNNISILSEELLLSGSTAKMAEIAAKQIYRIRESRVNLVTGEVDQLPADGESFKLIMQQLDQQEAALTALFLGSSSTEEIVYRLRVDPEQLSDKKILFRFSQLLGVISTDNLAGDPIYLSFTIEERGVAPTDKKGKAAPMPKNGLVYAIPGVANLSVSYRGKSLLEQRFSFSQLGTIFSLNPALFKDKKGGPRVQFYPETGAIRQIAQ